MSRPPSIVTFERLFLASIALGLVNTMLILSRTNISAPGVSPTVLMVSALLGGALGLVVMLALWYSVARRGSNIAKWLTVALAAYTLVSLLYGLIGGSPFPPGLRISVIVAGLLQLAATAMLFRPDARGWFGQRHA